jgi:DNA-binding transcriptional regulator YiaG
MGTLADVLKDWRRTHFMSQKDLAMKLGVTWGTVQRWEAGKGLPFPSRQRQLIEVLEISPDDMRAALDASEQALEEQGSKIAA